VPRDLVVEARAVRAQAARQDGLGGGALVQLAVAAAGGAPEEGWGGGEGGAEGEGLIAERGLVFWLLLLLLLLFEGEGGQGKVKGTRGKWAYRSFVSSSANR